MTHRLNLIFILLFSAFNSFGQDNNTFSIEIIYADFPGRPHVQYYLTENKIVLTKYFKLDSINSKVIDRKSYKVKNLDSLEKYLISVDWANHKSRSDRYCIDGYFYYVKISLNGKYYNFKVDCGGDPVLNKLVDISNLSIPSSKYRNKYKLQLERQNNP
jgi:hypothetical protein